MIPSPVRTVVFACCAALALLGNAKADSSVVLPYPSTFGVFPAVTYDPSGAAVGTARLSLLPAGEQGVEIEVRSGVDQGAYTHASAELRMIGSDASQGLQLLRQRSQSRDDKGRTLGLMEVDHVARVATCTPPPHSDDEKVEVPLPEGDRIVNVPLNLLFLPLVQGREKRIDFQFFLCRGGARIMDFRARAAGLPISHGDRRIIEVTYGPHLGAMVSWIAKSLVPSFSFWFEADAEGTYLAHRMPLFSQGPEVFIVREGLPAEALIPHN